MATILNASRSERRRKRSLSKRQVEELNEDEADPNKGTGRATVSGDVALAATPKRSKTSDESESGRKEKSKKKEKSSKKKDRKRRLGKEELLDSEMPSGVASSTSGTCDDKSGTRTKNDAKSNGKNTSEKKEKKSKRKKESKRRRSGEESLESLAKLDQVSPLTSRDDLQAKPSHADDELDVKSGTKSETKRAKYDISNGAAELEAKYTSQTPIETAGSESLSRLLQRYGRAIHDTQVTHVRKLLSGEAKGGFYASASLSQVLEWCLRILKKRQTDPEMWEILVDTATQMSVNERWSSVFSVSNATTILQGMCAILPDASSSVLKLLNRGFVLMLEYFKFQPTFGDLRPLVVGLATRLQSQFNGKDPSDATMAQSIIVFFDTVLENLALILLFVPSKKLVEEFPATLLGPLSIADHTLRDLLVALRQDEYDSSILLPLSTEPPRKCGPLSSDEAAHTWLTVPDSADSQEMTDKASHAVGLIEIALERALFSDFAVKFHYETIISKLEEAKYTGKAADACRKFSKKGGANSEPEHLFAAFDEMIVKQRRSTATAVAVTVMIPRLFELFVTRMAAVQRDEDEKRKQRRSDTESKISLEMRFFIQLATICGKARGPLGLCAVGRLLRVAIDKGLYDVTVDLDMICEWFYNSFDTWEKSPNDSVAINNARVIIIALLLEMDPRVVERTLARLFGFAFRLESPNEAAAQVLASSTGTGDSVLFAEFRLVGKRSNHSPCVELILRLADTYSKLRDIGTIVPPLINASKSEPDLVIDRLSVEPALLRGLGKLLGRAPAGQVIELWTMLLKSLSKEEAESDHTAEGENLPTYLLFASLLENLSVTDHNVFDLMPKTKALIEQMVASCTIAINQAKGVQRDILVCAGPAALLNAADALSSLCDSWKFTRASRSDQEQLEYQGIPEETIVQLHKVSKQKCSGAQKSVACATSLTLSKAVCKLAIRALRNQVVGPDARDYLELVISDLDSCHDVLLEHVSVFGHDALRAGLSNDSKVKAREAVVTLWEKIFAVSAIDATRSLSPLCNASFFELPHFRDTLSEAVKKILQTPAVEGRDVVVDVFNIVASMPDGYIDLYNARLLVRVVFGEEASSSRERALARNRMFSHLLNQHDVLIKDIAGKGGSNSILKPLILDAQAFLSSDSLNGLEKATQNDSFEAAAVKTFVDVLHAIGGAMIAKEPGALIPAISIGDGMQGQALVALLSGVCSRIPLPGEADDSLRRSFCKERHQAFHDVLVAIEELIEVLTDEAGAAKWPDEATALVAFSLCLRCALSARELRIPSLGDRAEQALEAFDPKRQGAIAGTLRLLLAIFSHMKRLAQAGVDRNHFLFGKAIDVLWEARLAAFHLDTSSTATSSSHGAYLAKFKPEINLATLTLFRNVDVDTGFRKVASKLLADLTALSGQPFIENSNAGRENLVRAEMAIEVLALGGSEMFSTGPRQAVLVDIVGEKLLSSLIRASCLPRACHGLSMIRRYEGLAVLKLIVTNCQKIWHKARGRYMRVILEGLLAASQSLSEFHLEKGQKESKENQRATTIFLCGCADLFHTVVKSGGLFLANKAAPAVMAVLQTLTNAVLHRVNAKLKEPALHQCFEMLARVAEELTSYEQVYRHHAVYWLSNYLSSCQEVVVPREAQVYLSQMAYHFLDLCSNFELQQIYGISNDTSKALFKDLRDEYNRTHKFRGQT